MGVARYSVDEFKFTGVIRLRVNVLERNKDRAQTDMLQAPAGYPYKRGAGFGGRKRRGNNNAL